jgi:aminocarboxymuconate-semialdehyde decarboxylase
MVYDVHAHCIPTDAVAWVERHGREVGIEVESTDSGRLIVLDGRYRTAPLRIDLTDRAQRIETMDRTGIDVQILSSWIDLTGYQLDPAGGLRWSRALNEAIAAEAAATPGRFLALGSIPLQDPAGAAEELRRAMTELGMVGVEIATTVDGRALDIAGLDEFWAAAEELGAFVLLHPMAPLPGVDLGRYFMDNMVGRPAESTVAFAALLFSGVFERFPGLTLCVVHGGGFVPFQIGRMNQGYRQKPGLVGKHLSREPLDYVRRNVYVDTVLNEPASLRFLVDLLGAERILVGTDYPFEMGDLDPVAFVRSAGLTGADVEAILSGNAARIFSTGSNTV